MSIFLLCIFKTCIYIKRIWVFAHFYLNTVTLWMLFFQLFTMFPQMVYLNHKEFRFSRVLGRKLSFSEFLFVSSAVWWTVCHPTLIVEPTSSLLTTLTVLQENGEQRTGINAPYRNGYSTVWQNLERRRRGNLMWSHFSKYLYHNNNKVITNFVSTI